MSVNRRSDGAAVERATYEWKSASVPLGQTDKDLTTVTGFTTLFSKVRPARNITIRAGASITVKLNSTSNDAITVTSSNDFILTDTRVSNIYVTTAGDAVTLTVILN